MVRWGGFSRGRASSGTAAKSPCLSGANVDPNPTIHVPGASRVGWLAGVPAWEVLGMRSRRKGSMWPALAGFGR